MYISTKIYPYVYKLTHRETGHFYIGYREANKIPSDQDILQYQTSSKHVKSMGFDNFEVEIIAEFFDAESAYRFENDLIAEDFRNPLCMNKHYTTKELKRKFKHDVPHTEEYKLRASKRTIPLHLRELVSTKMKGRKRDPAAVEKSRLAMIGHKTSNETKAKICESLRGKRHHRAKTWIIQEEDSGRIFTIASLVELCGHAGKNLTQTEINRSTLIRRSKKGQFYKNYRILSSDSNC